MKVYHYTKLDRWHDITQGSYASRHHPGLGANRRIGHEDPEAYQTGAVFALLEPLPRSWTQNRDFVGIWEELKDEIGTLLLEIDVDPKKDNVYVADRGHIQGFTDVVKKDIPKRYLHPTRAEAERFYMASKVSLSEYLERERELSYSLPEVIFTQLIPLERITVSQQQPLLEETLQIYPLDLPYGQSIVRRIQAIPELQPWYIRYQATREGQRRRKEK